MRVPLVSILIPAYNAEDWVGDSIESAVGQTWPRKEIIVVDNGSTDETGELLTRLDGVRVVVNPMNLGFPKAVNQGGRLARGDYLLLLNNDAEVLGRSIDTAVDFLDGIVEMLDNVE